MKLLHIITIGLIAVSAAISTVSAQNQYQSRSLLQKKIWFAVDGKADTASYWSFHLGNFPCHVLKPFPGEGDVGIDADMNFSLLSSMYIDVQGYGSRGKIAERGSFAIGDSAFLSVIDLDSIDYIYAGGTRVKMKDGIDAALLIKVQENRLNPWFDVLGIWKYNKEFMELKKANDIQNISVLSFSKDGIARAIAAQKEYNAKQPPASAE